MGIIEVPGYLTLEEAHAAGVPWRPRYRVESDRDRLDACSVLLSPATRNVPGWGWLCKVCARVPLRDAERWSWLGCRLCFAVDARAARRMGGKRFIPLGRHSIMNGAGIRLATPEGPGLTAAFARVVTMSAAWDLLHEWGDAEFARLAADAASRLEGPAVEIPLPQWREWFPPSREASADAYARMLTEQYPGLVGDLPMLGDARWLADGRSSPKARRMPPGDPSMGTEDRS